MKYIQRLSINNPSFNFKELNKIKIHFLNINFSKLPNEQLFKFFDIIKSEEALNRRNIAEDFIKECTREVLKTGHDEELLKKIFDFANYYSVDFINLTKYLDYINGKFRVKALEEYLKDDPIHLYSYFAKFDDFNKFSKEEINEFEKTFSNNPIIAHKYFYNILEKNLKHEYSVNDNEIGELVKKHHPHIYKTFINEVSPDARFIYNYINKRLSPEIENKMFQRNDPENIFYIQQYIKDRVPQFEKSLIFNDTTEINVVIKYFLKVVPYYILKLKDRSNLEILKHELNTTFKDFMNFFTTNVRVMNINQLVKMFDYLIRTFMGIPEKEISEEKHQFFINQLKFLMNFIKEDPWLFYCYCLDSYGKPWREAEDIFLRRIDHVTNHSAYTIIMYLRDVVLLYYKKDLKAMLNDYSDFEKDMLSRETGNEQNVIMSYMSTIRGRWPEGEAYLIEKNQKITDFNLTKFIEKLPQLEKKI